MTSPKPPTREEFDHHIKMLRLSVGLKPNEIEAAKNGAKAYADALEAKLERAKQGLKTIYAESPNKKARRIAMKTYEDIHDE